MTMGEKPFTKPLTINQHINFKITSPLMFALCRNHINELHPSKSFITVDIFDMKEKSWFDNYYKPEFAKGSRQSNANDRITKCCLDINNSQYRNLNIQIRKWKSEERSPERKIYLKYFRKVRGKFDEWYYLNRLMYPLEEDHTEKKITISGYCVVYNEKKDIDLLKANTSNLAKSIRGWIFNEYGETFQIESIRQNLIKLRNNLQ